MAFIDILCRRVPTSLLFPEPVECPSRIGVYCEAEGIGEEKDWVVPTRLFRFGYQTRLELYRVSSQ